MDIFCNLGRQLETPGLVCLAQPLHNSHETHSDRNHHLDRTHQLEESSSVGPIDSHHSVLDLYVLSYNYRIFRRFILRVVIS